MCELFLVIILTLYICTWDEGGRVGGEEEGWGREGGEEEGRGIMEGYEVKYFLVKNEKRKREEKN